MQYRASTIQSLNYYLLCVFLSLFLKTAGQESYTMSHWNPISLSIRKEGSKGREKKKKEKKTPRWFSCCAEECRYQSFTQDGYNAQPAKTPYKELREKEKKDPLLHSCSIGFDTIPGNSGQKKKKPSSALIFRLHTNRYVNTWKK